MKYLTKRKQFNDSVIFDAESNFKNNIVLSKERIDEIETLLMPIFKEEINKLKTGTSLLFPKK